MADLYLISITIAIVGVTWMKYLLDPDGLLGFLPNWYDGFWRRIRGYPGDSEETSCHFSTSELIQYKIRWVLFECEKCFSGQLALWTYIVLVAQGHPYRIAEHIILICLSVFFAGVINTILRKLQ